MAALPNFRRMKLIDPSALSAVWEDMRPSQLELPIAIPQWPFWFEAIKTNPTLRYIRQVKMLGLHSGY
jgi:hypothetical protein